MSNVRLVIDWVESPAYRILPRSKSGNTSSHIDRCTLPSVTSLLSSAKVVFVHELNPAEIGDI